MSFKFAHPCIRCGWSFNAGAPAKFCPPCKPLAKKEARAKYYAEKKREALLGP